MNRTCIAIIDASRARLFMLDRTSDSGRVREDFVEKTDLVNPARHQRDTDLFSSESGKSRAGNLGFGFDDHRDAHIDELDHAFARRISTELHKLADDPQVDHLIVCATPRMLGNVRQAAGSMEREGLKVDEVARDLVQLTPPQIREHLTSYGLLPV
jgi:protein required for attachment to host cells